jgi:hypothetical protein
MRIAIFSRTPLAAAPFELWKAIRKYTDIDASLINGTLRYNDGRTFPGDLTWGFPSAEIKLKAADVWHIHNYLIDPLVKMKNGQGVVAQFHSLPRLGNWQALMKFSDRNFTIRQPLHQHEYRLPALPNIIDPDEYRPTRRDTKVAIAFAPSSHAPIGHPASKGYREVLAVLGSVAAKRDIDIYLIEGKPYLKNLESKSRCQIVIDDVVTGNWHRTSLEGACFGCAVLNKNRMNPFVYTTLATLEERLLWLIDNPAILACIQEETRAWVESSWHAMDMVLEYVKVYREVAAHAGH